jgi:hypothetical protein
MWKEAVVAYREICLDGLRKCTTSHGQNSETGVLTIRPRCSLRKLRIRNLITRLKGPIQVRVWVASPARLGFQWAKLVCMWGTPRAGLARAFGGARLAIGSYVCGWSRASLAYPHGYTHRQCELCPCRLPCLTKHSWAWFFDKVFRRVPWIAGSVAGSQFLAHISLLFPFFFLPNTPHSSSIITAAATYFDELILDTEMYEQSWDSAHA